MSSDEASSGVTYTSISSDYEEPSDVGSPGVVIYGYDGLPMHPVDPPSPDYVSGPKEPAHAPLSPDYVSGPEYPKNFAPSDEEVSIEDQPYVVADSPIALSPGYIADSDQNGKDSHDSGTSIRRTERAARECTYSDFLKCQPLDFKGTEGVWNLKQDSKVPDGEMRTTAEESWSLDPRRRSPATITNKRNHTCYECGNQSITGVIAHKYKEPNHGNHQAGGNGEDSHDSGTGIRRTELATRECTYSDFLKCQPLDFKGTEGVVGFMQWFEKMETIIHISNCTVACQVKFAICTLQGIALTWWKSHVKTVTHEVAYAMTWKPLKKLMTEKYFPRGEIKKIEIEM
ncbi:hypothetical protein Tco_1292673 [Tanacetum coccineum]